MDMPYAVSLPGLTIPRVRGDFILKVLLCDVLDMDNPVECQLNKAAGTGVKFNCDEERAKAIIKIIRQKYEHWELPIFYSKTGNSGWRYVNKRDLAENGE